MRTQKKVSGEKAIKLKQKTTVKNKIETEETFKNEEPKKTIFNTKPIPVGITTLARVVGVDTRMIRYFQQQGIIVPLSISKSEGNKYELLESCHYIFKHYRDKTDKTADEKLRQLRAKRELEEMKVQQARKELHRTEDVKRIFGLMFSRLHSGFESYPLGTATKLSGVNNVMEIAEILKKQIDKILFEITNYDVEKLKADMGNYIAELGMEEKTEEDE
jgi:phage terminase Nu1 subunit (DNA packaging protein)